jgi:predicted metal-dependent peptidase
MPQPDPLQHTIARLLRQNPFLSALVLRLKRLEDPAAPIAWTDGVHLAVNPLRFAALPEPERLTVVAHECLHVALAHHLRRRGRDPKRWNRACDYAVNALLEADGFTLPEGVFHDPAWGDASAEAIYDRLPPEDDASASTGSDATSPSQAGVASPADGASQPRPAGPASPADGASQPRPAGPASPAHGTAAYGKPEPQDLGEVRDQPTEAAPTDSEIERQLAAHAVLMTALAQQSRAAGRDTLGAQRAAAQARRPPTVNWRAVLAEFLSARTAEDYSWCRPNPRYAPLGLYIPILESRAPGKIACVIDTSGSVPDQALAAVASELEAFLAQHPVTSLLVVYADTQETGRLLLTAADLPLKLEPKGGGGTDFGPVLDSLDADEDRPACIVYFTDLHGSFPDKPPSVPLLWLVFGQPHGQPKAPFGSVALLPY